MPRICYQPRVFKDDALAIIKRANDVVTEYQRLGFRLTLRQVYYQFVARDWLPQKWADPKTGSTNNVRSYKNLGSIINDARLAGLIDWHSIEDRTRERGGNSHWSSPESIISAVAAQYQIDKWQEQPYRPEVWVEKDALEDVVGTVCKELDVPFFSCRGYTSQTAMWDNAMLLKNHAKYGAKPVILHLGDHDPSGLDMSHDIEKRVECFMEDDADKLVFKRIALNMNQVRQYNPPPNPAKSTDARYNKYVDEHGDESWELDALDPQVLAQLIRDAIEPYRDEKLFAKYERQERAERGLLQSCSTRWDDVRDLLED